MEKENNKRKGKRERKKGCVEREKQKNINETKSLQKKDFKNALNPLISSLFRFSCIQSIAYSQQHVQTASSQKKIWFTFLKKTHAM